MIKAYFLFIVCCLPVALAGQSNSDSLTLYNLYDQLEKNYPLAQKQNIHQKITALNVQLLNTQYLPDISFKASASYQSDVTELPFATAGMSPVFSKDHYNIALELAQPLYNGGKTNALKSIESYSNEAEMAAMRSEMWQIRKQLEQIYFGVLILQQQKASTKLHLQTIEEQLQSVGAKVSNGILLPANALVLKAEKLKIQQQLIQLNEQSGTYRELLSLLTGVETDSSISLTVPQITIGPSIFNQAPTRSEFTVLKYRKKVIDSQISVARSSVLPSITAFATAGYGRPSLNAFENTLQTYWLIGLRAQWNFKNWINFKTNKNVYLLQQMKIEADIDALARNIQTDILKVKNKINTLNAQLVLDKKVLELRTQIVKEKENQLEQGVITSTEYLTELNAESRARLDLQIRKLQIIQAKIEFLNAKGIAWN